MNDLLFVKLAALQKLREIGVMREGTSVLKQSAALHRRKLVTALNQPCVKSMT